MIGGDGDLVLQALTLQGAEAFVLREVATPRAPGVGVCVTTLRRHLATARGLAKPNPNRNPNRNPDPNPDPNPNPNSNPNQARGLATPTQLDDLEALRVRARVRGS